MADQHEDQAPSPETELRAKLFALDSDLDAARADGDTNTLISKRAERKELVEQLQSLLPEDADLGYQRNDDKSYDKISVTHNHIPVFPESSA